ncbi:MAG: hypothetical protein AB1461_09675 [Thermodesulfobacteriota bacterium]
MNTTTSTPDNNKAAVGLTIKLPVKMLDTLHDMVSAKDVDINTLVSGYISNGIDQDMPAARRKCFINHVKDILMKHKVPSEAIAEINDKFGY